MEVTIDQGILLGLQQKTQLSNKTFFSFLGVPYAKPPTNDLRFKPPVEHPGWSGKLEAFSNENPCMQYSFMTNEIMGSEDCLYLNIFVPQEKHDEKKAVMVYIHGGAFVMGSGSVEQYSPDYLLDENVIVVTINYRLNVFGFLNLDIEECPGNMGLKDQRFAIKWVKENISAFGGDPENITIFGESAGAASVHGHILSPHSTGLFQKAIMQSGCMLNSWAMNEKHRETASRLAKHLGCEKNDTKETLRCLKTVPAIELLKFTNLKDETDFLEYPFIPSIESDAISNPFLPAHPEVLKKSASPVPIITGLTNLEGFIGLYGERMNKLGDFRTTESINTLLKGSYSEENVAGIKDFYFNEGNLKSEKARLENIVHIQSDMYFVKDFHRGFEHLLNQNVTPVYNYEFKFDGEINSVKIMITHTKPSDLRVEHLKGASHADDLNYLFYSKISGLSPPKPNSSESRMCKTFSKLWSNFAKNGDPNSPDLSFEWKKTSLNDPKYLSIDGDHTKMVDGLLYGSRVKLWENISNAV